MARVPHRSVAEELASVRVALNAAMNELSLAEFIMARARAAAERAGKPTDTFDRIGSELQTLVGFANEKGAELLQELAVDEADSRG